MKESTENVSLHDASWSQVMCEGLAVSESCVEWGGIRGAQLFRSYSVGRELGEAGSHPAHGCHSHCHIPHGLSQSVSPELLPL